MGIFIGERIEQKTYQALRDKFDIAGKVAGYIAHGHTNEEIAHMYPEGRTYLSAIRAAQRVGELWWFAVFTTEEKGWLRDLGLIA